MRACRSNTGPRASFCGSIRLTHPNHSGQIPAGITADSTSWSEPAEGVLLELLGSPLRAQWGWAGKTDTGLQESPAAADKPGSVRSPRQATRPADAPEAASGAVGGVARVEGLLTLRIMLYLYRESCSSAFPPSAQEDDTVRCTCPVCSRVFDQDRNREGLNYCTNCQSLFLVPPERSVPFWIWGVLVVVLATCQVLGRL